MQPNNESPVAPTPQQPPVSPIHDVAPPEADSGITDLTKTGAVFSDINASSESSNPIAGTAAPKSGVIHDQSNADPALEGVLQQVTNNIKAAPPASPQAHKTKHGFFGGGKAKKQHPPTAPHGTTKSPVTNPIHQAPPKPKKPVLPIVIAIFAAIGLGAVAVVVFK